MKRPESLHDISDGLLEMLWTITSGSTPSNSEDAAPWALSLAEQIYGRGSWQYASGLFHMALYGRMTGTGNGKMKQFVFMTRRAVKIYQATGGPNISYSDYQNCCFELATHLMEHFPGKHRPEVCALLKEVILFEQRHGMQGLSDDADDMLRGGGL